MGRDDSFGIGYVGAGFITQEAHAPSVQYVGNAHVAGIMNPTVEKAVAVADECAEHQAATPAVYGDVRELVRDADVDGVWVTSPNYTRINVVEAIVEEVEQGRASLIGIAVEKPVARNLAEAREIFDLIDETNLSHAYLENWGYIPGVEKLKELLWEQGAAATDRPYLARAYGEHSGPHAGWFWDGEKQGGGALNDMMSHAHLANRYLLTDEDGSDVTPVAVVGNVSNLKWGHEGYADQVEEEFDVEYGGSPTEDYANATVFYETDEGRPLVAETVASWCYVEAGVKRTVELLGPEYSGRVESGESTTNVFFSSAVASSDGELMEKQAATQGRLPVESMGVVNGGYVNQTRDIVDAFREDGRPRFDLEDGLQTIELCMASYKSAEEGERIDLQTANLEEYVPEPARGDFDQGI